MCQSFDLPVAKQTRTYHFRTLRDAGLIRDIDCGNKKGILLRRNALDRRFPGLFDLLAAEFGNATRSRGSRSR
ncbi:hypothetical protein [Saccharopolyspora gloriosae]|uniref:hypothetical protein n=1 Tax=Saccharopolyspora gloriosae TaxID=455344 RepID=UPI001FB61393|nr:hypothetical protein [Saccharopolyspora gloriosae]